MLNPLSMSDKAVLITGASSGIGRETAILFSKLGAKIVLVGRNKERLKQTQDLMCHNNHIVIDLDINDTELVKKRLSEICHAEKKLDGMVHCAGIQITTPLQFVDAEIINNVIQSNLIATIHLAKVFRQKNIAANPSSMIFMSSVTALFGQSGLSLYAATKGAILSLTKSLAIELARQGIRVNCIVPGMIDTEMSQHAFKNMPEKQQKNWRSAHLLGIGEPVDIANMAAFLIADTGKWITGASFVIDGGFSTFKVEEG